MGLKRFGKGEREENPCRCTNNEMSGCGEEAGKLEGGALVLTNNRVVPYKRRGAQ